MRSYRPIIKSPCPLFQSRRGAGACVACFCLIAYLLVNVINPIRMLPNSILPKSFYLTIRLPTARRSQRRPFVVLQFG